MASATQSADPADARSMAEAADLIERAHRAWQSYRAFSQSQVDAIVDAMAAAATAHAERLAQLAVEETTYGKVADKIQKNLFASERVYRAIRGMRTVGVLREDRAAGIIEMGVSMGVVAAILPCTNPTSTAIYKIPIALKAGNAIVLSPHPAAMRCICEAVGLMQQAALTAGAPTGLIGCFSTPTRAGTQAMMRHPRTRVILATGGMGIVHAAYSSGKPAFGVGPGNVPAYIDASAKVEQAVADVVAGKSFDWGTICSSEQSIVAETALREKILAELKRQNVYLLNPGETEKLGATLILGVPVTVNPQGVGHSPQRLAALAGFGDRVGPEIRALAAELSGMGKQFPLSAEKLSPVLALFFMPDRERAMDRCRDLLRFGGLGQTCVIHAQDEAVIREYGARMPAYRVVVNSPSPQGSIGLTTNLFPAMTLGCGAIGGNITSDNIGPQHLINIKRVAWNAERIPAAAGMPAAAASTCTCQHAQLPAAPVASAPSDLRSVVERLLAERGIRPAEAPAPAATAPAPPPAAAAAPAFTPPPLPPKPQPVDFVCEADVRAAIAAGKPIAIGPRTIVTPAARDLGREHNTFLAV
ncbi:MAG: aldehyde dehydrogenase family protein [Terriglobales bacterium]